MSGLSHYVSDLYASWERRVEEQEKADYLACTAHRAKFGLGPDDKCEEDCTEAKCQKGCPL